MWVSKYYSINEFSWEKKMSIRPNREIRVELMGVRNNGEPILARSFEPELRTTRISLASPFCDHRSK